MLKQHNTQVKRRDMILFFLCSLGLALKETVVIMCHHHLTSGI